MTAWWRLQQMGTTLSNNISKDEKEFHLLLCGWVITNWYIPPQDSDIALKYPMTCSVDHAFTWQQENDNHKPLTDFQK